MKALSAAILCAAGVAALAAAAPAHAAQPPPGDVGPVHRGFYFNTDVGPAAGRYNFSGPRDSGDAHGWAANIDLRFGYALTGHLIVSADLTGSATANNPDTTLDGRSVHASSDYYFGSSAVAVGLTWYWDDNLFLGGNVGAGRVVLHFSNPNTSIDSNTGFAAQLRFGKEWWVGDNWGLGIVGGVSYVSAGADSNLGVTRSGGGTYVAHLDHMDATVYFVGFTASFN